MKLTILHALPKMLLRSIQCSNTLPTTCRRTSPDTIALDDNRQLTALAPLRIHPRSIAEPRPWIGPVQTGAVGEELTSSTIPCPIPRPSRRCIQVGPNRTERRKTHCNTEVMIPRRIQPQVRETRISDVPIVDPENIIYEYRNSRYSLCDQRGVIGICP